MHGALAMFVLHPLLARQRTLETRRLTVVLRLNNALIHRSSLACMPRLTADTNEARDSRTHWCCLSGCELQVTFQKEKVPSSIGHYTNHPRKSTSTPCSRPGIQFTGAFRSTPGCSVPSSRYRPWSNARQEVRTPSQAHSPPRQPSCDDLSSGLPRNPCKRHQKAFCDNTTTTWY